MKDLSQERQGFRGRSAVSWFLELNRDDPSGSWLTKDDDGRFRLLEGETQDFQKMRRVRADEEASVPVYILTDDDYLALGADFVDRGLSVMERHPEFGILSAWPVNASIARWTPEGYAVFEDDEVVEHVNVGGLRFCRKGVVREWPAFTGPGYDKEHCEAIRAAGYRVGYMKNVKAVHLGEGPGKSTVWRAE